MSYEKQLAQAAEKLRDAGSLPDDRPKKAYQPAFKVGEKDHGIITGTKLSGPPWPGDQRLFLSVELTHPISDRSETVWIPLEDLTDAAAKWVSSQLKNMGYDLEQRPLTELGENLDEFIGRKVEVFTKLDTYGKKPRYKYYINRVVEEAPRDYDDITF